MTSTPLHRALTPLLLALAAGCTHTIKVEPIKVEPIDITLHIYLEADQKLDEFFSDVETPAKPSPSSKPAPTTPSTTAPSEGAK